jgi:hypothetical protein
MKYLSSRIILVLEIHFLKSFPYFLGFQNCVQDFRKVQGLIRKTPKAQATTGVDCGLNSLKWRVSLRKYPAEGVFSCHDRTIRFEGFRLDQQGYETVSTHYPWIKDRWLAIIQTTDRVRALGLRIYGQAFMRRRGITWSDRHRPTIVQRPSAIV